MCGVYARLHFQQGIESLRMYLELSKGAHDVESWGTLQGVAPLPPALAPPPEHRPAPEPAQGQYCPPPHPRLLQGQLGLGSEQGAAGRFFFDELNSEPW